MFGSLKFNFKKTSITMNSKIIIFFFVFATAFAKETILGDKNLEESQKPKRGLKDVIDYGFNPFSTYPNFDLFNFDDKETSPYFITENKIPIPLNPAFRIPDPEVNQIKVNGSPFFKNEHLSFPQKYDESLLLKPEYQGLMHSQFQQPLTNQQTSQPSMIPQFYQHLTFPQTYQLLKQQYIIPEVKDEIKPIVEENQE